jgi:hypothetical protein
MTTAVIAGIAGVAGIGTTIQDIARDVVDECIAQMQAAANVLIYRQKSHAFASSKHSARSQRAKHKRKRARNA